MPEIGSCGVAFAAIDSKEAALKRFSGPNRAEYLLLVRRREVTTYSISRNS